MKDQQMQNSSFSTQFSADTLTTVPTTNKCALSFILGSAPSSSYESQISSRSLLHRNGAQSKFKRPVMRKAARPPPAAALANPSSTDPILRVLNKGSKFCIVDGCMSRSKLNKLCWRHGGSIKCKVVHCTNRAKSRGVCWSHGGGSICSFENCETISVSNGCCWAHGGGKRCLVDNCSKPACERTHNYCAGHFKEMATDRDDSMSSIQH